MLGLLVFDGNRLVPCREVRQRRTHGLAVVVPAFLIHGDEAWETHALMAGPEDVSGAFTVDGNRVKHGVCHLGGKEAAPDELIQLILVGGQAPLHPFRLQLHMGGADGFVGILRPGPGLEDVVTAVIIVLPVAVANKVGGSVHGFVGQSQRVGTHIGDEARGALAGDFHAFVELLGHHHGLLGGEAQLPGGLLL